MRENAIHALLSWGLVAASVPTAIYLRLRPAPYGRYTTSGFGPELPARLAWVIMEIPALLWVPFVYALGSSARAPLAAILLGCWMIHYAHRTLIFPLRLAPSSRSMPLLVALAGFVFQVFNGYLNARGMSEFNDFALGPAGWGRVGLGAALFFAGMAINLHADTVLLRLRRDRPGEYSIPTGGLYRFVSCPNYLGELMEWAGFFVMAWNVPALGFFCYSLANLGVRALSHHAWYRERFEDYPRERRALLPFVL